MPASGLTMLCLPIATLGLALGYPAQGRHAIIVGEAGQPRVQALDWLVRQGATVAGAAGTAVMIRIPDDSLALKAAAAGVLLVAVPGRTCGPDGESA